MELNLEKSDRKKLLGLIHSGAKKLGLEDEPYRQWLEKHTGFRSTANLPTEELRKVIEVLTQEGAFEEAGKGGKGPNRPTDPQWAKLAALGREMGWNGFRDDRMKAFVKRVVSVDDTRFLTRKQISMVICGLEHWVEETRAKNQQVNAS